MSRLLDLMIVVVAVLFTLSSCDDQYLEELQGSGANAESEPPDSPIGDPDPEPFPIDFPQWQVGGDPLWKTWVSGNTDNLSPWIGVSCYDDYGENYLLTGITGYREPAANLDKFNAKLEAHCQEYENDFWGDFVQVSDYYETDLIYSAFHREPGELTLVEDDYRYPVGIYAFSDIFDNYVRYSGIFHLGVLSGGFIGSYASPKFSTPVPDSGTVMLGNPHSLLCQDQHVMTGVRLRYDTTNGKIRILTVECRSLSKS